eukprot:scaffold7349_cov173-Amphora_coffeaeformis.AAC.69
MKGTIAEMVINEIASLEPPGRFLEPLLETSRFREVSRKRAIEKTCQALREKKNNAGQQEKQEEAAATLQMRESNEQEEHATMEMDQATTPTMMAEHSKPDANEKAGLKEAVPTIM